MRKSLPYLAVAAAALALTATPTFAKNKHGGMHCPPGLAKKNPPCVPPGHAKIGHHYGDYDYERINRRHDRYDLFRIGDVVVGADRKTGRILHIFDDLVDALNS